MRLPHALVAAAVMSSGYGFGPRSTRDDDPECYDPVGRVILTQPNLATFTSERPLTKRQRRRQRGKTKP